MKKLSLLPLAVALHVQAAPSSMEGTWEARWACKQGPGCPAGEDIFHLDLRTHGDQVCAKVLASAHGGNKVEEDEDVEPPSIVGRFQGAGATVAYTSNWGGHGVASIRVEGPSLSWRVLWHDAGESYIPSQAVLHRSSRDDRPIWRDFVCPQQEAH